MPKGLQKVLEGYHSEKREDLQKTGVYAIYHINKPGYYYVGSAAKYNKINYRDIGFLQRWRNHVSNFKKGTHHNLFLGRVVSKYGVEGVRFKIIEICDPFACHLRESYWIKKYMADYKVYNFSDSTHSILGTKQSKEVVRKRIKGRMKVVYQYTLNGEFIKKWESASAAARGNGVRQSNISTAIKRGGSYNGYRWSRKRESLGVYEKKIFRINKKVFQFDFNGNMVNTFDSPTDAANKTGTKIYLIIRSCRNLYIRGGDYIWSYDEVEHRRYPNSKKRISVVKYDKNMNLIKEYPSLTIAAKEVKSSVTSISNCCKMKPHYLTVKGFVFRYKKQIA